MSGELAAFAVFVVLMVLLAGWMLRRGRNAVQRNEDDS